VGTGRTVVEGLVNVLPGRDLALLLKQEGTAVFSADLSTSERDGTVVVTLYGELDIVDAAEVATALVAAAVREPRIIVDLAGLDFIDSSGIAALAYARRHARQAGGDLVLAAPQQRVRRVLAITRLVDAFCVHASVEEAASAGQSVIKSAICPGPRLPIKPVLRLPPLSSGNI
jgi:anti-sigma B factor antagonist